MRNWELVNCPYCNEHMEFNSINETIPHIEKGYYYCYSCDIHYERITIINKIGLMKFDTLYELDEDKNHIGEYKGFWD